MVAGLSAVARAVKDKICYNRQKIPKIQIKEFLIIVSPSAIARVVVLDAKYFINHAISHDATALIASYTPTTFIAVAHDPSICFYVMANKISAQFYIVSQWLTDHCNSAVSH